MDRVLVGACSTVYMLSVYVLLTLSTQNKLFGNEHKANDHTQQFI